MGLHVRGLVISVKSQNLSHPLPGRGSNVYNDLSSRTLLLSPSKCKGFTRISEDSSEIAFLLVENYTMTAHFGLRIGMEFLKTLVQTFHLMPSFMEGCEEEFNSPSTGRRHSICKLPHSLLSSIFHKECMRWGCSELSGSSNNAASSNEAANVITSELDEVISTWRWICSLGSNE